MKSTPNETNSSTASAKARQREISALRQLLSEQFSREAQPLVEAELQKRKQTYMSQHETPPQFMTELELEAKQRAIAKEEYNRLKKEEQQAEEAKRQKMEAAMRAATEKHGKTIEADPDGVNAIYSLLTTSKLSPEEAILKAPELYEQFKQHDANHTLRRSHSPNHYGGASMAPVGGSPVPTVPTGYDPVNAQQEMAKRQENFRRMQQGLPPQ